MGDGADIISSLQVSAGAVAVQASKTFTQRFLRHDFHVTYTTAGQAPVLIEELAIVPFLANVAPIIWLADLDVCLPALDATFAAALDDIRAGFADMYPNLKWAGSITAERTISPAASPEQTAVLFSGGVDSVYSSFSVEGPQMLTTVQGSDIALDNAAGWDAVCQQSMDFGRPRGHRNVFVQSNFRQFLNVAALERWWPDLNDWWSRVQHGMGLLGLVAPLIPAGRVVIAATHTAERGDTAWGSSPKLDTSVRWGDVVVDHHGYDASRQDKVEAIVAAGQPAPRLRVCYSNKYGYGDNCGRCEKCLRTLAALIVAGADPVEYGFAVDAERGMRVIRRRFATYRVPFNASKTWHWEQIQRSLQEQAAGGGGEEPTEVSKLLDWLKTFDFPTYQRRWRLFLFVRNRLDRTLRRVPAVERIVRRYVVGSRRLRGRTRRPTPSRAPQTTGDLVSDREELTPSPATAVAPKTQTRNAEL